jgi:hypothetical protein
VAFVDALKEEFYPVGNYDDISPRSLPWWNKREITKKEILLCFSRKPSLKKGTR